MSSRRTASPFLKKPMRAEPKQPSVQLRRRTLARDKGEIPRLFWSQAATVHVLADCAGKRVLTRFLQCSSPFQQLLFGMTVQCYNFRNRWLSFR